MLIVDRPGDGFVVLDAVSQQQFSTFPTFAEALSDASTRTTGTVWHQATDNRGRSMGDPVIVLRKRGE